MFIGSFNLYDYGGELRSLRLSHNSHASCGQRRNDFIDYQRVYRALVQPVVKRAIWSGPGERGGKLFWGKHLVDDISTECFGHSILPRWYRPAAAHLCRLPVQVHRMVSCNVLYRKPCHGKHHLRCRRKEEQRYQRYLFSGTGARLISVPVFRVGLKNGSMVSKAGERCEVPAGFLRAS